MRRQSVHCRLAVRLTIVVGSTFATCNGTLSRCAVADFPHATIPNRIAMNTGVISRNLTDQDFQLLKAGGVNYLRIDILWNQLEQTQGVYLWSSYDALYNKLNQYEIKPIFILAYNNGLYNSDASTMNTSVERNGYASYAAATVARYDAPGVIWELWNEQDTDNFWKATTSGNTTTNARERAANYVSMVDTAVPAMRAASPNATIISGGVLDPNWSVTQAWLDEAFSRGLLSQVDGVGIHFYGGPQGNLQPPESRLFNAVASVRSRIIAHGGAADFPILNTEWGVRSELLPGNTTEQLHKQAEYEMRMYLLGELMDLELNTWYQWRPTGSDQVYAFIDNSYNPRPNYDAMSVLTNELAGYQFQERIKLTSDDDYVALFRNGEEEKLVVWTTAADHVVSIPVGLLSGTLDTVGMLGASDSLNVTNGYVSVGVSGSPRYISLVQGSSESPLGDYNGNGSVDAADYTIWRDSLGEPADRLRNRNPEKIGPIDVDDYDYWRARFGNSLDTLEFTVADVPEPSFVAQILGIVAGVIQSIRMRPAKCCPEAM